MPLFVKIANENGVEALFKHIGSRFMNNLLVLVVLIRGRILFSKDVLRMSVVLTLWRESG